MKKIIQFLSLLIMLTNISCGEKNEGSALLRDSKAPFGAPEFHLYSVDQYKDAFEKGIAEKRADIKKIIENSDAPTFENTIEAIEKSGKLLDKVSLIFFTLNESDNSDEMTEVENHVVPLLTDLSGYIYMNDSLFARIRTLYDAKENLGLDEEQAIVLDNYYKSFVRGGALLNQE